MSEESQVKAGVSLNSRAAWLRERKEGRERGKDRERQRNRETERQKDRDRDHVANIARAKALRS